MQMDQRFVQGLQNENMTMRQEINRLNAVAKSLDEKYQKCLKEMSSIIHANQNLKQQLDNLKAGAKDQIETTQKELRATYEKRIEAMIIQKNDMYVENQNILREKQQLQRNYSQLERSQWEAEALKAEVVALKKQNQKLLLQTHPLTQNQDNPEYKVNEQKLSQKIQQLNAKIVELNVQNAQSRKYNETLETEKSNFQRQIDSLNKKINELSSTLEKLSSQNKNETKAENESLANQSKKQQMQTLELRKINAGLANELERMKLQKLELASGINKNEAELHLLQTLKSLHSQLEPMRYEIEQLKRDKYFERENTNKEKAELQIKLLSSEHELETLRQNIKELESKSKDLGLQLKERQWEKYKFQELEEEKRILEGRVIVYQAMEMVTRNRQKPHHVERIQQFERRIQILLEEENLQYLVNNANVHQLIAMKAYVIELDNKLQTVAEQNEHLSKRYGQYKEKYQLVIGENKQIVNKHYSMINAYKGKIAGYEKLVIKLTDELEKYIKDSQGPSSVESHYKSVITLYESKILSIYNQANAKKQENRDLNKKIENLELEFKGKVALIREYQIQLSNLKAKNKDLSTKLTTKTIDEDQRALTNSIPEDHYKKIISQKTKQILELEESISRLKLQLDRMEFEHDRNIDNYKHRISRLQIEIEQLRLEQGESNKQLSSIKHSQEFGELVLKLSSLQKNMMEMSKSQVRQQSQAPSQTKDDSHRQLETLAKENQYLNRELQNLRRKSQDIPVSASSQDELNKIKDMTNRTIKEMESRIYELEAELKVKTKQLEIKGRQIQRAEKGDESPQRSKQTETLEEENKTLRIELDRIKVSYRSMTQQSEGLMNKIRETEAYISRLKDEFDLVGTKMNQYERELGAKDKQIHELKLRLTNLQEQHNLQLKSAKMSADPANNKEIQEKLRKIKQTQMELERAHREIESKLRDIERRDMEVSRRESEFEIKNRDFRDRIKKVEQRERIVSEQQNRLIALSHRLEEMERKLVSITPPPSIQISPAKPQPSFKQELHQLERKYKRLEIELSEKLKILEIKEEKTNKMIKEKAELTKENQQLKAAYDDKSRQLETNERQLINLKNQCTRLEGELEKLWKEFDLLKQQIRVKDREISDAYLERDEAKKKYELENRKVKQLESFKTSSPVAGLSSPPKGGLDINELERQFESRVKQMEERYKQKMKQLYAENEQNMRDQQQTIFDLKTEINRLRSSNSGQTNKEIDSHTATMQSLESHIKILEEQVRRKGSLISQLQDDLKYYKDIISQREDQLQRIYESTKIPSNQSEQENSERKRLQAQIAALQNMIQSRNQSTANHDECVKKQHLLRMEIERLSGILQSKISDQASEKPQSPRSNYLDNSYLNDLEETNKSLEVDLNLLKQRLIADFDTKRTIDEYLAIMVLTFAEVDALRQRVYELEQNFKEEHEREMNMIKQIDSLKEHDLDIQKILSIIKQLEVVHRTFHEEEERSKSTFIKRINTEVLVMPGSQALSINQEINKPKIGDPQMHRLVNEGPYNPNYFGERSIANGLIEDSQIGANSSISNLIGGPNIYSSIPGSSFRPAPPSSHVSLVNQPITVTNTENFGFNAPLASVGFSKVENSRMNSVYTTNLSNQRPSSFGNEGPLTMIGRQSNFASSFHQSIPISGSPTRYMEGSSFNRTQQYSPSKALEVPQPYRFYQPSEGSESSMRFPSQTNIRLPGAPMIINSPERPPSLFLANDQLRNRF